MATCGKCTAKTTRYEDTIQCTFPECKKLFHTKCIGMDEAVFTDLNSSGNISEWVCKNCKDTEKSKNPSNSELYQILIEIKNQMKINQKDTNNKLKEMEKSQAFIAEKYEEINKKMDEVMKATTKIAKIETNQQEQKKELVALTSRLNHLEQYSRKNYIEINEVKQDRNENCNEIVLKIAKICAIPVNITDIEAAHRLKAAPGKTPGIIVKFNSRNITNQFIEKKKMIITNENITKQGNSRIYICESLSPFYRELLWKTKNKAKENKFTYVWWKGNAIYARKETGTAAIKILCEEDLAKIK